MADTPSRHGVTVVTPTNTALIYIHSPRYWEIGAALEALPVTLVRYPYNFWMVWSHPAPYFDWVLPLWILWRVRRLPHLNKVVLIDRMLRLPWFIAALRRRGCRFVVRLRGNPWAEAAEERAPEASLRERFHAFRTRNWFENLRMADAVWALSRHLESVVRERCPGKPTAVVGSLRDLPGLPDLPPGLPDAGRRPSPPTPGAGGGVGEVRVLTATVYMFRQKTAGVLRLYDLMEAAIGRWPGIRWSLCGGGRHFARSRSRWRASPMRERIEFPGRVADLKRRMGEAHVFAYCSEMDVLPNVVLDAMAAGLPVLCNRWGAFPEIFAGDLDWCLYADEAEFLQKLERLATDPEHWRRMADAGTARVREMFSVGRVREELEHALAGLLT